MKCGPAVWVCRSFRQSWIVWSTGVPAAITSCAWQNRCIPRRCCLTIDETEDQAGEQIDYGNQRSKRSQGNRGDRGEGRYRPVLVSASAPDHSGYVEPKERQTCDR